MKTEILEILAKLSQEEEQRVLEFIHELETQVSELDNEVTLLTPEDTEKDENFVVGQDGFYYDNSQTIFFAEDIKKIVQQFPADRKWVFADLQNEYIFPREHFVKIEITDYKLYIMPDPSVKHQEIVTNVSTFLNLHALQNRLGKVIVSPVSIKIDNGNVKKPDILFISVKKLKENPTMVQKQFVQGSPNLVVEVISPANYKKLREEKKQRYEDAGIEEYWEIYPEKEVVVVETLEEVEDENGETNRQYQVYSEASKTGSIQSKVLEGFTLDLKHIFPEKAEESSLEKE